MRILTIALTVAAFAACSKGSDSVTLHGAVLFPDQQMGHSAAIESSADCSDANPTAGFQVTIYDGSGAVVGTATTVGVSASPISPPVMIGTWCSVEGSYSVAVPREEFYTFQVEAPNPIPASAPVAFANVESSGFTHDVTLTGQPLDGSGT